MSEDKHYPPPAPVPDALQDHKPTDKPAARGVLYAIIAVFVIGLIALLVIYGGTHEPENRQQHSAPVPPPPAP